MNMTVGNHAEKIEIQGNNEGESQYEAVFLSKKILGVHC